MFVESDTVCKKMNECRKTRVDIEYKNECLKRIGTNCKNIDQTTSPAISKGILHA